MNHDSEAANVEWLGLGLGESSGARVSRPVLEGEELLYSYGCKGNTDLVLGYGFALWDNPHEAVSLAFDIAEFLSPEDSNWPAATAALAEAAVQGGADTCGVGCVTFR